jgi:hypothetical protein
MIAFNAILNRADLAKTIVTSKERIAIRANLFKSDAASMEEYANYLGTKPVEIVSGGCAANRGFSLFGDPMANSVLQKGSQTEFTVNLEICCICFTTENVVCGYCPSHAPQIH